MSPPSLGNGSKENGGCLQFHFVSYNVQNGRGSSVNLVHDCSVSTPGLKVRKIEIERWKEECGQMFPVVGSGRFITAPIITEDGANGLETVKDKKAIQWMLTLHQIVGCCLSC
nr:hypothetical protein CFP56_39555 [Quercus suber]